MKVILINITEVVDSEDSEDGEDEEREFAEHKMTIDSEIKAWDSVEKVFNII